VNIYGSGGPSTKQIGVFSWLVNIPLCVQGSVTSLWELTDAMRNFTC